MTGNPALIAKICARIARDGPLRFRDFMEMALYDAGNGFYSSGRANIGREGDFFTNVSVGPLFGEMLGQQFFEIWQRLDEPRDFRIVEQGAHAGDFAHDVLAAADPAFLERLNYTIIEPSPKLREIQCHRLRDFASRVTWHASLAEMEPWGGVHFSNELLDAFPIHLVRFSNGEWVERCLDARLELIDCPICDEAVRAHTKSLLQIEGYETEINLDALSWIGTLAQKMIRGYALVIDYGLPRDVLYAPERRCGTLSSFVRHRRNENPLEHVGEADLTAHVDFTSLAEHALACGLELEGFTDQHHFMVALSKHFFAERPPDVKQSRTLSTLLHPELLGATFKVIAFRKNLGAVTGLRGFEFASDAVSALGIRGEVNRRTMTLL